MSDEGADDAGDANDPPDDALDGEGGVDVGERADESVDDPVDAFVEDATDRPDDADEDPFERIGAGPVPEGDPFSRLDVGADGAAGDTSDAATSGADHGATGPGHDTAGDDAGDHDAATTDVDPDPFDGFEAAEGDPFAAGQTAFERVDVADVDPDGVWERVDGEGTDDAAREVSGRRYVEVSKHSYCERCEYFSTPPNVGCSHEGTQILEFTDVETVRLVDCPIVAERTALEDGG